MSKIHKLEIFLLVLSQFADFVTTLHVLSIGGYEINPVMSGIMRYFGIFGFFISKLLLIILIPPSVIYLLRRNRTPTLYFLHTINLFYLLVVSSNISNFIR